MALVPVVLARFCIARHCTVPGSAAPSLAGPGSSLDGLLLDPAVLWLRGVPGAQLGNVASTAQREVETACQKFFPDRDGPRSRRVPGQGGCPCTSVHFRPSPSLSLPSQSSFAINSPVFPSMCHRLPFISEMGTAGRVHESTSTREGLSGA